MATDKKHIAVYLAPEVEQALIAFCQEKGLISKKGTMFSAGVNAALVQFFGIADTESGNIPQQTSNIPQDIGNIPQDIGNILASKGNISQDTGNILATSKGNIPVNPGNTPAQSLVMEVLPGKLKA